MPPRYMRLYYAIRPCVHVYVTRRFRPVPIRHARFALDGRHRSTMAVVPLGRSRSAGSCRVLAEILTFFPKLRQTDRGRLSSLTSCTRNSVHRFGPSAVYSARCIRNDCPRPLKKKHEFFKSPESRPKSYKRLSESSPDFYKIACTSRVSTFMSIVNGCESFRSRFNRMFGKARPKIHLVIKVLTVNQTVHA